MQCCASVIQDSWIRISIICHEEIYEKSKYINIFNDLLPIWQHIFFTDQKHVQVESGSGRISNYLASWILIRFCNSDYESADSEEIFTVLFYNTASMLLFSKTDNILQYLPR
jgi:hypothetical protein